MLRPPRSFTSDANTCVMRLMRTVPPKFHGSHILSTACDILLVSFKIAQKWYISVGNLHNNQEGDQRVELRPHWRSFFPAPFFPSLLARYLPHFSAHSGPVTGRLLLTILEKPGRDFEPNKSRTPLPVRRVDAMRLVSLVAAVSMVGSLVMATPISCSDAKRDLILKGELPPEACCSYGRCQGDVVVAML